MIMISFQEKWGGFVCYEEQYEENTLHGCLQEEEVSWISLWSVLSFIAIPELSLVSVSKSFWEKEPKCRHFKGTGEGGGVPGSKMFSPISVVALLMGFLKWAHLSLNSQRLLKYESSKMQQILIFLWSFFGETFAVFSILLNFWDIFSDFISATIGS